MTCSKILPTASIWQNLSPEDKMFVLKYGSYSDVAYEDTLLYFRPKKSKLLQKLAHFFKFFVELSPFLNADRDQVYI